MIIFFTESEKGNRWRTTEMVDGDEVFLIAQKGDTWTAAFVRMDGLNVFFFQCFKRWKIRLWMLKNDRLVVSVQLLYHISVSSDLFQGFYNRLKPLL